MTKLWRCIHKQFRSLVKQQTIRLCGTSGVAASNFKFSGLIHNTTSGLGLMIQRLLGRCVESANRFKEITTRTSLHTNYGYRRQKHTHSQHNKGEYTIVARTKGMQRDNIFLPLLGDPNDTRRRKHFASTLNAHTWHTAINFFSLSEVDNWQNTRFPKPTTTHAGLT